jgi:hypothetical protein
MPSTTYYQSQAEVYRRLAAVAAVPQIAARLLHKAQEFETKANSPRLACLVEIISEEMQRREQA